MSDCVVVFIDAQNTYQAARRAFFDNHSHHAKGHSAQMKQCAAWEAAGVHVVPRALRYPGDWPRQREQEKGIDVALAVDFVTMAIDDDYDVGMLVSADTDLTPALEYVAKRPNPPSGLRLRRGAATG